MQNIEMAWRMDGMDGAAIEKYNREQEMIDTLKTMRAKNQTDLEHFQATQWALALSLEIS